MSVTVKDELTQRDLSRLAIRSPLMNGVSFSKRYRRIYPQAHLTGHITGYVSPVTPRELDELALGALAKYSHWQGRY